RDVLSTTIASALASRACTWESAASTSVAMRFCSSGGGTGIRSGFRKVKLMFAWALLGASAESRGRRRRRQSSMYRGILSVADFRGSCGGGECLEIAEEFVANLGIGTEREGKLAVGTGE